MHTATVEQMLIALFVLLFSDRENQSMLIT